MDSSLYLFSVLFKAIAISFLCLFGGALEWLIALWQLFMSMDRANSEKRVAAQSANGIDLPGAYVATLVSESVAVESKFMESKPAEPAWVQPKLTVTEPKVTESKATESKFTESKPLESKTTELKPLEPKTAEPIANATSPKRKRLFAQPLPRPDPSKLPTRRTSVRVFQPLISYLLLIRLIVERSTYWKR